MREPIIKYLCPVCRKEYDRPEDAQACYVHPRDKFKVGDIVWDGYFSNAWRIVDFGNECGVQGASVQRPKEFLTANGLNDCKAKTEVRFMSGGFWCKAMKMPTDDTKRLIKVLKKQLTAAESFLKELEDKA